MEEINQNPVDSNPSASSEGESKQQVSYDSFRKSVEAEKNARKRAQELEARVQEYERKEMEAKGQYEKIAAELRKENETLKATMRSKDEAYHWDKIQNGLKAEAKSQGFRFSPDEFISLLKKEDLEALKSTDGQTVPSEAFKLVVENFKKTRDPNYFTAPVVEIKDAPPTTKIETNVKPKTAAEQLEFMKANLAKALN